MTEPRALLSPRRRRAVWLLSALAVGVLALGYYLDDVLNPFLIALLIAYILNPLVEWLEARRVGRRFAVSVLFAVVLLSVSGIAGYGAFEAATHMGELRRELSGDRVLDLTVAQDRTLIEGMAHVSSLTTNQVRRQSGPSGDIWFVDEDGDGVRQVGLIERITTAVTTGVRRIPLSRDRAEQIARGLETQAGQALELGIEASQGLQKFLRRVGNFLGYVLLVPVYTFFLLLSLSDLRAKARDLLPGRHRARILDVLTKIDRAAAAFFRGRVLIALGKGLVIWLGLAITGVRFPFFIGIGAGLLSIIPIVGPLVGGSLALILAFEGSGSYLGRAIGVLLTFGAAEGLETAAFPIVIGRETGLHPLALILSLFAFGHLFGLFGLLLAVPIACVVKILFVEFVLPELRILAQEEADPEGDDPPPPAPVTGAAP